MGRNSCCVKQKLRKGLWSPEEDEKLYNYITRFGVGCWSSVPKLAGLQRCGKSCRLRWINYLRPDLKRGMFSQEEEDLIISLHEALGNRWAQIAAQLPGRTDNEIKNFWNSSLKKKLIKKGIDPNTHKLMIRPDIKDRDHKDSTDISASLQTKGLPNLSTSAPEFHQMNKQVYDPIFLSEFQANIDHIPDYQSGFLSHVRPYHDEGNHGINTSSCGFNSMPNLANFDQMIEAVEYVSSSDNSASRMSQYATNEAKESSSNGNNRSCGLEMDTVVDNEGPFFWEQENKLDSSIFEIHNQSSGDYGIYPMTASNLDCFQQI